MSKNLKEALKKKLEEVTYLELLDPTPDELQQIGQFIYLDRLDLHRIKATTLPDNFGDLIHLKRLNIIDGDLKQLPETFGKLSNLQFCTILRTKLEGLPSSIGQLQKIIRLNLTQNAINTLPVEIGLLTKMRDLILKHNKLTQLPDVFADMYLEELDISYNKSLKKWPASFKNSHIQYLHFRSAHKDAVPEDLFYMHRLRGSDGFGGDKKKVLKFIKSCYKANIPYTESNTMVDIFYKNAKNLNSKTNSSIFLFLTIKNETANLFTRDYILNKYIAAYQKQPLSPGAEFCVLGKINYNTSELKQKVEQSGLKKTTKIKASTKYVVLGKSPKSLEGVDQEGLIFISEEDLKAYFHTKMDFYLEEQQNGSDLTEHLLELLHSSDNKNVRLGFKLMESGGIPKEIMTELYILYKYHKTASIKKMAKNAMMLGGSKVLQEVLTKHARELAAELDVGIASTMVKDRLEHTEIDLGRVFRFASCDDRFRHGNNASLFEEAMELTAEAEKNAYLNTYIKSMITDNHLYIKDGFRFDKYYKAIYQQTHINKLTLNIHYVCEDQDVKEGISALQNLRSLSLWGKHHFSLPPDFAQLSNLEYLSISVKDDQPFPMEIFDLPRLKTLRLRFCELKELPEQLVESKTMEVLDLQDHYFVTLPKVLFKLQQVKSIDLRPRSGGPLSNNAENRKIFEEELKNLKAALPNTSIKVK